MPVPRSRRSPQRDLPDPGTSLADVLRDARWHVSASQAPGGENLGAAGSALDATGNFAAVPADAWTGTRLVGYAERDSDYATSEGWFTDLDVEATFQVPPHAATGVSGQWAELFHIPVTGGGGVTEYVEFALIFRTGGDLAVGVDFESGSETGGPSWTSDLGLNDSDPPADPYVLGDWSVGVDEVTVRLQIVAVTGAVTLKVDGSTVCTDTIGAVGFTQPTNGDTVQVGPFAYVVPMASVTLRDGIDGDPLIAWESGDAGWTCATGGSFDGTAPTSAWLFAGDGEPITVPNNSALNVGASASATWAVWATVTSVADADNEVIRIMQRATGTIGAGGEGIEFFDGKVSGFGVDFAGASMSDGTNLGAAFGAHWSTGPHVFVLVINRGTNTATLYLDNASHATADISAVGAIDPAANLTLSSAAHHAAAKWDRVLTAAELRIVETQWRAGNG